MAKKIHALRQVAFVLAVFFASISTVSAVQSSTINLGSGKFVAVHPASASKKTNSKLLNKKCPKDAFVASLDLWPRIHKTYGSSLIRKHLCGKTLTCRPKAPYGKGLRSCRWTA